MHLEREHLLAAFIHRALSRNPQDRFPDVAEMRKVLLPFCGPRQ
jgi:hypothetical protein